MGDLEIVFRILWSVVLGALVYGSAGWLLRAEMPGDIQGQGTARKKTGLLGEIAWINAIVILAIEKMDRSMPEESGLLMQGGQGILCSLLAGGLLAAACMDAEKCYVYNYVWWWCLLWIGILLGLSMIVSGDDSLRGITDSSIIRQAAAVVLFVLLQQLLFAKMYGRADCHAFSVCALAGCIWQGELIWFLIHMLLAVISLAVVQLVGGNVAWNGKLRVPKPFIPYIVVTFWAELLIMLYLQGGATHIYA